MGLVISNVNEYGSANRKVLSATVVATLRAPVPW